MTTCRCARNFPEVQNFREVAWFVLFAWPVLQLISCTSPAPQPITPAFFCWQTSLSLSPAQLDYLNKIPCKKLYVKIADIGLEAGSGAIIPYAQLQIKDTSCLSGFEIVRVVFITNEVFRQISSAEMEQLAEKIAAAEALFHFSDQVAQQFEFQVDCDWTNSTRESFFQFLKTLRLKLPAGVCLSATIRLHQYKFPERSGVPPVDRGMLMCYNTGDIDDAKTINSILDLDEVRKYIHGAAKKYPIALDLALPVFSWTLVYRGDELWKIIPGDHDDIPLGVLKKGTFLAGHYLRPGDLLRREIISADLLKKAAQLAATIDLADDATLAFYHLDSTTLSNYPVQLIDAVCKIVDSTRVIH